MTGADQAQPFLDPGRKFKALMFACIVFGIPVVGMFVLVLASKATTEDFIGITKWMGIALSPIFASYIGGVALEGFAEKRGPQSVVQSTASGDVSATTVQAPPVSPVAPT